MQITDQEFINELLSIEAMAELIKQRATGLRKRMQSEKVASPQQGLSPDQTAALVGNFRAKILKRQNKKAAGGTAA